jgi:glycosyltransferase involved in cell wall biosynthesis
MEERHAVVTVDDGSDDKIGKIADDLAVRYPGRMHAVHHEVNKGYGATARTGIATALEQTDSGWIFLTDSDGQFRGAQLPGFLAEARAEQADAVIGYREHRADPAMRKVNAWLWDPACHPLPGIARDADCAYKLISRRVLGGLALRGDRALTSLELLMGIRARNARVLQRPVTRYPGCAASQPGPTCRSSRLSLLGLLGLFRQRLKPALRLVNPAVT